MRSSEIDSRTVSASSGKGCWVPSQALYRYFMDIWPAEVKARLHPVRDGGEAPFAGAQEFDETGNRRREPVSLEVDDVPLAMDREALHVEDGELAGGLLQPDRVAGEDGQAEPALDRVLDGAVGAQFHPHLEPDVGAAGGLLDGEAGARALLPHQEGLVLQVLQGQVATAGERVLERRDDDQLVGDEGDDDQVGVLKGRPDHGQVELVAEDLLLDVAAGADLEADGQARVQLLEGAESHRDHVDADRGAGADLEGSTHQPLQLAEGDLRLVDHVQG